MSKLAERTISISKIDEEKQIVKGIVYKPNVKDSQGDWMTAEEIEKSAHGFMRDMRIQKVDTKHTLVEVDAYVCETYIAKDNDPDGYPVGSWVVGMKIEDPTLWEDVKKGEYEAFSMWGKGKAFDGEEPPVEEVN